MGQTIEDINCKSLDLKEWGKYSLIKSKEDILSTMDFGTFEIYPKHFILNNPIKSKQGFIFNADINPHFLIGDLNKTKNVFFEFNPRVIARIRNDFSGPVKTPSWMPGGNLYFGIIANFECDNSESVITSWFVGYQHHSNGQDSCALKNHHYDAAIGKCVPNNQYNPDDKFIFNRENGNFSTNIFYIGRLWIIEKPYRKSIWLITNIERVRSSKKLFIEIHPAGLFGASDLGFLDEFIGYEKELKNRYPFLRLKFNYDLMLLQQGFESKYYKLNTSEKFRFSIKSSVVINSICNLKNWKPYNHLNIIARFHLNLFKSSNAGFYIESAFIGSDEYNIFFEDSYYALKIGLHTGFLGKSEKRINQKLGI
ncbi:MAG TPA: hypothetical protein PLJ37_10615 [Chitinophagales bacterium]|nr:hypothetical protein [Chitinophagales bacterium]HNG27852.1 hypothetical protein [Chitinophagales bacterium]HNL05655.1 hypothetical protein [Bacteroidia bacterium]